MGLARRRTGWTRTLGPGAKGELLENTEMGRKVRQQIEEAGSEDDCAHVALCLAERAPVWTYDKDFPRMRDVLLVTTSEVLGLEGPPP